MAEEERQRLDDLAATWNVTLSDEAAAALLSYGRLLLHWNARINLTGATTLAELVVDHFPDAFAIAGRLAGPQRLIDVGSGGGLPAIPLILMRPLASLQLVEPTAKKVAFLRTAIRDLGLGSRVTIEAARLETLTARDFDAALSRATFHPAEWLKVAFPLVRPGGLIFALSAVEEVALPDGLTLEASIPYAQRRRWLLELKRST